MLDQCEYIFDRAIGSSSGAEFCYAVDPLFENYKILTLGLGRGTVFWRARTIKSKPYENISELDYPPVELSSEGRLNDKGVPVFYAATREETALAEVNVEDGQLVQLAGFKVVPGNTMRLSVVGEYSNVVKSGYMHFAGLDPDKTILNIVRNLPHAKAVAKIYIDRFFAHILADPTASESSYIHSRALGHVIHSKAQADGIAFPSVKDRGGFNICVKAENSDLHLRNVACLVVRINKRRRFGLIDYDLISTADNLNENGDFQWHSQSEPKQVAFYGMTKDEFEEARANAKGFSPGGLV
uniref:RES family NAD+ phosphorylase n=1 Tax=Pseudomonas sp. RW407 TaxID=2202894 RepID=UPI001313EFC8|nr:RES family NAD+ phosphorylase [Pseudomonas sp. RW407]